jgi:hypothetical protein
VTAGGRGNTRWMFSRRNERRWALRWLGGPVERLSSERRRELIEAAAARGRMSSRGALVRLRENLLPVVQTAAAAALAWLLANSVFGHANPVFAPIAAIVSLGAYARPAGAASDRVDARRGGGDRGR